MELPAAHDPWRVHAGIVILGGYTLGSFGTAFTLLHIAQASEAAISAPPVVRDPARTLQPSFTFASWEDEEEL